MDEVVSVVFQSKIPEAVVNKVDVPSQLSTTVTVGAAGVVFGDVVTELLAELGQPSTV